ncbi:hypothetical protein BC832DRAFT_549376 [Gaertneriomyces semiglobifer]|nr:hypothetical protein BC832DRAFT_549376 [Gaertneriomyces semiglobifer]
MSCIQWERRACQMRLASTITIISQGTLIRQNKRIQVVFRSFLMIYPIGCPYIHISLQRSLNIFYQRQQHSSSFYIQRRQQRRRRRGRGRG